MTTVHPDLFARGEYKRFCTTNTIMPFQSCRWCGQTPKRLYSYVWCADYTKSALYKTMAIAVLSTID